jgi:putative membrane protein
MNMHKTALQCGIAAALLASIGGTALAQSTPSPTITSPTQGAATLARADKGFLEDAVQINIAEIRASNVALEKATNPDVKAYARMMVDGHKKATDELRTLALAKGVTLPDDASLMDKAKTKVLEERSGASFDKHYIESIGIKAHEDAIKRFEKASKDAKDPEVKAFADKLLPDLRTHLEKAKSVAAVVGAKGG